MLLGLGCLYLAAPRLTKNSAVEVSEQLTPTALAPPPKTKPIEQVKVGERVPAKNPTGEFDNSLGEEVDPATWRKLTLRAPKTDGSHADVVLLRPLWWIDERAAQVGGSVHISVPECGIDGDAELLAIDPCPPLAPGEGRVVVGTFAHQSAAVVDIHVEGLDEPIGSTANHPFWVPEWGKFVAAGDLLPGERLHALSGAPRITSISPRGPPQPVYNLQVHGEHVYQVSSLGLLVHNTAQWCPTDLVSSIGLGNGRRIDLNAPTRSVGRPSPRQSELDVSDLTPNHRPQVSFSNGREVPYASRGSVRPDNFRVGEALEVKNYDLLQPNNRANLYNTIHRQYLQRISNLPKGTHQRIVIDIRGQNVPESILMRVRSNIQTITRTPDVTVEFLW